MAAISNDWLAPLSGEFRKPYYRKLYETVMAEYRAREIYPAPDDIFNAFAFTPLAEKYTTNYLKIIMHDTPITTRIIPITNNRIILRCNPMYRPASPSSKL